MCTQFPAQVEAHLHSCNVDIPCGFLVGMLMKMSSKDLGMKLLEVLSVTVLCVLALTALGVAENSSHYSATLHLGCHAVRLGWIWDVL